MKGMFFMKKGLAVFLLVMLVVLTVSCGLKTETEKSTVGKTETKQETEKKELVVCVESRSFLDNSMLRSQLYEYIDPEQGLLFISRMSEENKCDTTVKHVEHTFKNKIATSEGGIFLDFDAYSNDGKRVKFSDYVGKGKVTVLNVWSTSGRNVQSDVAEFKALADTFKDKVEFVSFAIDRDVTAWNDAIKKYEMWWNNISDMKGWSSQAIFSYGINSFPYNIIFDAYGTILHKGINTEDIYSKLEKELN
jgi:hypothetical protein